MQGTLESSDTEVIHAIIDIYPDRISFEISHGKGSGVQPYGGKDRSIPYSVETAYRMIEKIINERNVETTEVCNHC